MKSDGSDQARDRSRHAPHASRSLRTAVTGLAVVAFVALAAPSALADEKDEKGHDEKHKAHVVVIKKVVPPGTTGEDVTGARPAAGWTFTGTTATAGVGGLPSTQTTGDDGSVAFELTFEDASSAVVAVAETQQPAYELVTQGGFNAVCHDHHGGSVAVTDDDATPGRPGFSITVPKKAEKIECVVYNRLRPAEVTVLKRWEINGQAYDHGSQPAGFDAELTLTGPGDAGPTPQAWGVARGGYVVGETVTIDERVTLADPSCRLDAGRVTAVNGVALDATLPYAAQLVAGANAYTITNRVTCPPPPPFSPPPEVPPTPPPTAPPPTAPPPAPVARPAPRPEGEVRGVQRRGRPRLRIEKRASETTVVAGDTVRYTLVVSNVGRARARGLTVCDRLPDDVTVVDRGGGRLVAGALVCWRIRSLRAGATTQRRIVLRVDLDADCRRMVNRAVVRGEGQRRSARNRVGVQCRGQQPSAGGEQVTG